jgi:hypothetical protein
MNAGGSSPTQGTINEPSISYSDFLFKLNSDEVTFVDFLAPNGDVAYATLKQAAGEENASGSGGKIRIGEGFPLEVSTKHEIEYCAHCFIKLDLKT